MKKRNLALFAFLLALVGAFFILPTKSIPPTRAPSTPRIVSFAPASTECLFFLGLGPFVVGRSPFCDTPPEAASLPIVGDYQSFDESALASLRPTHAIVSSPHQPVVPYLQSLGISLLYAQTSTDTDILSFLTTLGSTFSAHTNGILPRWMADMRALEAPQPSGIRAALLLDSPDGPRRECMLAGKGSYYDALMTKAGLTNPFSSHTGFVSLAPEELLKANLDRLYVVSFDRTPAAIQQDWGAWMGPHTRILPLTESWAYRPGPRMTLLLKSFAP